MRRAYVFRLRPSARQHIALAACVEAQRELYNAALQERQDAFRLQKKSVTTFDQSKSLTKVRKDDPDGYGRLPVTLSRWTLKRLDLAYAAFFDRLKARNGRTGCLTWEHALPVSLSPPLREDRSIGAHLRIKLARYWAGSTIATIESRPTVSPAWQRIDLACDPQLP